jgi:hypothetical protein
MRFKLARIATAGVAVGMAFGPVTLAQADSAPTVRVPCNSAALAAAITSAALGETLRLTASCRYVLTVALPAIGGDLTIAGNGATLQRSAAAGTPAFALLTATAGNLTVSRLNFRNGSGGAISYQSGTSAGGSVTVSGAPLPTTPAAPSMTTGRPTGR